MPKTTRLCDIEDCKRIHRARGLCQMHYKRAGHAPRTRYPRTCEVCTTDYLSERRTGRFCSDACKGDAYRHAPPSRELVGPVERTVTMLPARHPALRQHPKPRVWYAGVCAWCTLAFVDNQPQARFCSKRCGKQMSRHRQGRFTVPPHVRLAIYVRDEWTCQLCLESVDQQLMSTDPLHDWAPSLDHIVCQSWTTTPDHSEANLRLAHRWCNAVRSDGRYYTESDLRISHVA